MWYSARSLHQTVPLNFEYVLLLNLSVPFIVTGVPSSIESGFTLWWISVSDLQHYHCLLSWLKAMRFPTSPTLPFLISQIRQNHWESNPSHFNQELYVGTCRPTSSVKTTMHDGTSVFCHKAMPDRKKWLKVIKCLFKNLLVKRLLHQVKRFHQHTWNNWGFWINNRCFYISNSSH